MGVACAWLHPGAWMHAPSLSCVALPWPALVCPVLLCAGGFSGFPALGVQYQCMESDALRRAYKMGKGQKGAWCWDRG